MFNYLTFFLLLKYFKYYIVLDYITTEIPAHLLRNICSYLNKKDLLNFMLVCRCFYDIG